MKKLTLFAAVAALTLAVQAQTETQGQPGVVINKASTTTALAESVEKSEVKSMNKLTEPMDKALSGVITRSEKFTVLERGPELNKLLDEPTRLGDALQLSENDYAIFIKLDHFLDKREKRQIGGRIYDIRILQLTGFVKIVGGIKANILAESDVVISVESEPTQKSDSLEILLPKLTRKFAAQSAEKLLDLKFPMMVEEVMDGVITIDRGEDFLTKGEKVEIYGPSRQVTNTRTGKTSERKGTLLGTATIISVEPSYAQAKADGKYDVPDLSEVRKIKNPESEE
jgi:hypothetical protein